MIRYRTRPIEVDAYQYDGDGLALLNWAGQMSDGNGTHFVLVLGEGLQLKTKLSETCTSTVEVSITNWVICSSNGMFSLCSNKVFNELYEPFEE